MTLLDTERLVRKISDLLQQAGNAAIAPKLAEDFAAACHAASLRLQQCEAMIKAGDRHQAIQLAETAPNLLDLVTVLEFRGSDDWRNYCRQNSLPVADRIDARSVHALNECYAQGITTDHPLYAIYRRAVLNRNDDDALKALQSITRLNPADANAASELGRLDAKVLAVRLKHLGNSLEGTDPALLVAEIETIEGFGFKNQPDGDVWRKAQMIRCGCLLEEAARFRNSSRWLDALARLDFIKRLQNDFKLELPAASMPQFDALEIWAQGEQEKDKKERAFQSLLAELQYRIHQSEEKDTSARFVKLPELRDDYEALNKVWRSLTDFTRPIPEEASSSFSKRSVLLEAEIVRRTAIHRRVIVAGSLATFVIGTLIVWVVLGKIKAGDFTRQLQQAVTQRQVHTTEKLLERARTEKVANAGAVADAETFVTREHALLANFEAALKKLPQQLTGEPDASRLSGIADQLALTHNAADALAPDLKKENEPRLQAFEKQWQKFLSESGAAVNGLFDEWVASAEKQARELDYRSPLEKATAQITALGELMRKIRDCESGFTNQLSLRSDLLQRSAAVRAKFEAYDHELKKLEDGMAAIRKARTTKEFSDGIGLIASSEFTASPAAIAASAVQSLDASEESTVRTLLGITNVGTWAYIEKEQPKGFIPEIAMPAEQQIFRQFNSDAAISGNYQRYRFWLNSEGTTSVEWITTDVLDVSTGWKQIWAFTPSKSTTSVIFERRDYGYFDGQCKLSATRPVYRVVQLGSPNETTAFRSSGLGKVWPGGDSYAKPLLEVLDSMKDSSDGSPLFRAYMFLRLIDLMNLQSDAWGLAFCPSARADGAEIKSIVGEGLNSGDWFVAAKANYYGERLEKFFSSAGSVSYVKQADGLLALDRAALQSGFRYVGFVGLDGKPNVAENSTSVELWGYSAARKQPVLLAASINAEGSLLEPAMPLSPLFALPNLCKEYLAKADVNPGVPSFQGALPPLFQQRAQR